MMILVRKAFCIFVTASACLGHGRGFEPTNKKLKLFVELQGLEGSGLILKHGKKDVLEPTADGRHRFKKKIKDDASVQVQVARQPAFPDQTCSVGAVVPEKKSAVVSVTCRTPVRHVVILGIDGMGGRQFLPNADVPFLKELMDASAFTLAARNTMPTSSSTNWMSMTGGTSPRQHGVLSNSWSRGDSNPPPTLFAEMRAAHPLGKKCREATECSCREDQTDYRGFHNTTKDGVPCQKWTSQTPHEHTRTPENYPGFGLGDHNYCRNPDGEPAAWCYTTEPGDRWELCGIPQCPKDGPHTLIEAVHDWGSWDRLVEDAPFDAKISGGDEDTTRDAAVRQILNDRPELLFVHIDHVDHAGHSKSWGSPEYYAAIAKADGIVEDIVNALRKAEIWNHTALIISSDHGGKGYSHGGDTAVEREIPIVVRTPQGGRREINREVRIWDIAATAGALLGLDLPDYWIASPIVEALPFHIDRSAEGGDLYFIATTEYTSVWTSTGLSTSDLSFWRPVVPEGYLSLGDVAVQGLGPPSVPTYVVRADHPAVARPRGYELVWESRGDRGGEDVTFWNPIPPPGGYTCPGEVVAASLDAPPTLNTTACVLHGRLEDVKPAALLWTDRGSSADWDGAVWACVSSESVAGIAPPAYVSFRSHSSEMRQPRCYRLLSVARCEDNKDFYVKKKSETCAAWVAQNPKKRCKKKKGKVRQNCPKTCGVC